MTTYAIDFSDPLKTGFSISPGGFNGPGGSASNTTLRLYGRGALEWGEAVDEDLVRLTENFNGATPAPYPVGGQLWFQTKLFWRATGSSKWWLVDPDSVSPTADTWTWTDITFPINATGPTFAGTNVAPPHTIGQYWYTGGAPVDAGTSSLDAFGKALKPATLYVWDTMFKQVPAGWLERTFQQQTANPVSSVDAPERQLLVWDEYMHEWTSPPTTIAAPITSPPASPGTGAFWWNTTDDQLNIWDGSAWVGIILSSGTQPWIGPNNFDMGGFRIVNLGAPIALTDAATKGYVDTATSAAALQATLNTVYLRLDATNDPLTGLLTLNAGLTVAGGSTTITSPGAYPQPNSLLGATVTYVNSAITSVGTPSAFGFANTFNFANSTTAIATHKPGDIYVDTSVPKIYIAVSTNSNQPPTNTTFWKQVYPAVYS